MTPEELKSSDAANLGAKVDRYLMLAALLQHEHKAYQRRAAALDGTGADPRDDDALKDLSVRAARIVAEMEVLFPMRKVYHEDKRIPVRVLYFATSGVDAEKEYEAYTNQLMNPLTVDAFDATNDEDGVFNLLGEFAVPAGYAAAVVMAY